MRYANGKLYIDESLAFKIARLRQQPPPIAVSELARLGEVVFTGPHADTIQRAIDRIVDAAALTATGAEPPCDPAADLEIDRALTPGTAIAMREYAASKVVRARGAPNGLHRVTLPADFHPAYDCGVWESGASYGRGALTTDHGTLWSCQAESTSDRPGTSGAWRLMVKNQSKQGTR